MVEELLRILNLSCTVLMLGSDGEIREKSSSQFIAEMYGPSRVTLLILFFYFLFIICLISSFNLFFFLVREGIYRMLCKVELFRAARCN